MLIRVFAKRNNIIKRFFSEIGDCFAALPGDVDANFLHNTDCARIQSVSFQPCRICINYISFQVPRQSLGHLASTGITGAEKQYVNLVHHFAIGYG